MSPIPVYRKDKNETISSGSAPSSDSASLLTHLSGILNRITAITGLTDWKSAPPTTLQSARNHMDLTANNPHGTTAAQVGAITEALLPIKMVRFAATTNVATATNGLAAIEGTTPVAGDRVLLMGQTAGAENGIWVASAGAWTRALDADTGAEIKSGSLVSIKEGTYGSRVYQLASPETDPVIGTDALAFTRVSRATATETQAGESEFATDAETTAGTDRTRAVNPAGLKVELDKKFNKAGGTVTGATTFQAGVELAADPTTALGAATKQYVDASRAGFNTKAAVRAASVGNIALATGGLTPAGLDAGAGLTAGDRVLVKNQTAGAENGIYVAAAGAWARAADADASAEVTTGMYMFVDLGEKHGGEGWILKTTGTITLGTTVLEFEKFIDGYAGSSPNVAWDPVRVATTANVDLVTGGLLTIDTIVTAVGDRVLVKSQTDATQNGIYIVASGAWTRALDANESRVFTPGKVVSVSEGASHRDQLFALDNVTRPTIGTSSILFVVLAGTGGGGGGSGGGSVYWKDAVRVVTIGNIVLSGAQTIDGIAVVAGDRVGVIAQNAPAENGIYVAATGAWARATDADSAAELDSGFAFTVREGTYKNVEFVNNSASPVNVGVTALNFIVRRHAGSAAGKVCNLRRGSAVSITNIAWNLVPWDVEESDPLNMFSSGANGEIVIQETGDYQINAAVRWAANGTGNRWMAVTRNSTNPDTAGTSLAYTRTPAHAEAVEQDANPIARLNKGDTLRVYVYQDSGAALDLGVAGLHQTSRFSAAKIESSGGASAGIEAPATGVFMAYSDVNQALTANTANKVVFPVVEHDVSGWFVPGSSASTTDPTSRYTPKKAGFYRITANINHNAANNQAYFAVDLRKNGTSVKMLSNNAGTEIAAATSAIVYANGTTDYFEITVYPSVNTTVRSGITHTFFQGEYIGSLAGGGGPDPFAVKQADLGWDHIVDGLNPSVPGTGLDVTVPRGTAIVRGRRIVLPSFTTPVPASSTGFHIDVNESGTFTTTTGALAVGSLRLFTVTSNATNITAITPVARRRDPGAGWTIATLQNSWVGDAGNGPSYYKAPDGMVHVRGVARNGTADTVVFTLPVGYRPASAVHLPTTANDVFAFAQVNPSGTVVARGSNVWFDFSSIKFRPAAYTPTVLEASGF